MLRGVLCLISHKSLIHSWRQRVNHASCLFVTVECSLWGGKQLNTHKQWAKTWSETISSKSVNFRRNCWMLCSLLVFVLAVANLAQICQIWKIACRCQRVSFLKWVGKPENCHLCELNARIVCESQHNFLWNFTTIFFIFFLRKLSLRWDGTAPFCSGECSGWVFF